MDAFAASGKRASMLFTKTSLPVTGKDLEMSLETHPQSSKSLPEHFDDE